MSIITYPDISGTTPASDRIIASSTSATPITDVGLISMFNQIIPARSLGPNGYIILDIYMTRAGTSGDISVALGLGGTPFHISPLGILDTGFQTRFYIYADDSENAQKIASDMSIVDTPYTKGTLTKVVMSEDLTLDTHLTMQINIANVGDSFVLEGYSIRLFNPDGI
jgi:hypothetical protein